MLLKWNSMKLLLLFCVMLTTAAVPERYRHYCPQCEEEVWDEISKRNVKTDTTASNGPNETYNDANGAPRAPSPTSYDANTSDTAISSASRSAYNRCYSECKLSCKELCRKVTLDGVASEEQITPNSKAAHGELAHFPQQRINSVDYDVSYNPNAQPILAPTAPIATLPSVPVLAAGMYHLAPNVPQEQQQQVYAVASSGNEQQQQQQQHAVLQAYEIQPPPPLHPTAPNPSSYEAYKGQISAPLQAAQVHSPPHTIYSHHSHAIHQPAVVYPLHTPHQQQVPQAIYKDAKDTSTYPDILLDSSYSVQELTDLLQMEGLHKDATSIASNQPARPAYRTLYGGTGIPLTAVSAHQQAVPSSMHAVSY